MVLYTLSSHSLGSTIVTYCDEEAIRFGSDPLKLEFLLSHELAGLNSVLYRT